MKHENAPPSDTAPTAIDSGDSVASPAGGSDPAGVVGLALGAAGAYAPKLGAAGTAAVSSH